MELRIDDTLVNVPDDVTDPTLSIRRRQGASTATRGPGHDTTVDATSVSPGASGPPAAQRTMPRISIDLGEPRGTTPHTGADLEVTGLLGEGGMGRVLLARQHTLQREVAVKVMHDGASDNELAALLDEGAIVGSLEHPAIIPVHALGLDEQKRPVLVMKRIEGVPLDDLLRDPDHELWADRNDEGDRLERGVEILIQVCNAVDFAHRHGVLHLDVKPSNVMVGRHGEVYLVDWGVARRVDGDGTIDVVFAGTPCFAAPEMVAGANLGRHSDVYLLGATLHVVLTGKRRHSGESLLEVFANAVKSEPPDYTTDVPSELAALATSATSANVADRPATAAEFRSALVDFLGHRSAQALTSTAAERVAEMHTITGGDGEVSQNERARVDELMIEARFALDQALALWPESPQALAERAQLDALIAERREREADLARVAAEHDTSRSAKQRGQLLAAVAAAGLVVSATGVWRWHTGAERTTKDLFTISIVMTAIIFGLAFAFRRHVWISKPNRVATVALLTLAIGVFTSRAVGYAAGAGVPEVLTRDLFFASAFGPLTALWLSTWNMLVAVELGVCAVVSALRPDLSSLMFSLGSGSALITVAVAELRAAGR